MNDPMDMLVARKISGCCQKCFARLTGLSRYSLSLIECGYRMPTADEYKKMIKALRQLTKNHKNGLKYIDDKGIEKLND